MVAGQGRCPEGRLDGVDAQVPVVWLCGPPGVGKTSVAWQLYRRGVEDGRSVAFVDVDQTGICYPERADDLGRHRLKARNVDALRRNVAAAGAECLIVSGVVDAATGPVIAGAGSDDVFAIRLRADPADLVERLTSRRGSIDEPHAALREAAALDHARFDASVVDTTGATIDEIVADLDVRVRSWQARRARANLTGVKPPAPAAEPASAAGHVLWLLGPSGVGKSTVGFRAYLDIVESGRVTAFVDIDQLGFFDPAIGTRTDLRAKNLAALWDEFSTAGAELAVVVGPLGSQAEARVYADDLPNVGFTWCTLHADEPELTRRILSRGRGGSWPQPGDPLRGRPTSTLLAAAAEATARAPTPRTGVPGPRVDVSDLGVAEAAGAVLAVTNWPPPEPQTCRVGR